MDKQKEVGPFQGVKKAKVLCVPQRSGKLQKTEGPAQGSALTEDNGHTQGSYFLLASVCCQRQEAPNPSAEAGQDLRRVEGPGKKGVAHHLEVDRETEQLTLF